MIYVSSSCVKTNDMAKAVTILAEEGFSHIELSGGTRYLSSPEKELLKLKEKYSLQFLCHNYFPAPEKDFVLNLAAEEEEVFQLSKQHILRAIQLSEQLGASKFGFHAGFLINIPVNQVGKSISRQQLADREKAMERFCNAFTELGKSGKNVKLYIENNVLSEENYRNYNAINPFFITDFAGYREFRERISFLPLLDVAHLKVSVNTLKLDFEKELHLFFEETDYIHISDNDGKRDSNNWFSEKSELFKSLKQLSWKNKTVTLEVYDGMEKLKESYNNVMSLF